MGRIRLFVLLFSLALPAWSQTNRVLDNLPPGIKWYHINTEHFRVIFPAGFEQQGQRMANTLELIHRPVGHTLGATPRKRFPVVLQSHTAISNGFVTVGPFRSEFFAMSPQAPNFVGNLDWLNMLALHEYRHVIQYERSRTGFTGFVRTLLGQYSMAVMAGISVPSWYWEGDAVGIETALSPSGRGRIPAFSAAFRANLLERGPFNYNKQYLRSFKDFIPNHYVLGYYYSTYLRNRFGAEAVEQMVNRAWALSFVPFTFSFAQKKYGGYKMPKMYLQMAADLQAKWQAQQDKLQPTPFTKINTQKKKVYTHYDYPQVMDNGHILVLKSGLGDFEHFIEINPQTGEEKKHFVPGVRNDAGLLSLAGSMLVWNEYTFDPRWRQRTYSVIRTYNLATGKYRELTRRSRYTAAAISPDRSRIATIEETTDYRNRLLILNAYTGQVTDSLDAPAGSRYFQPQWADAQSLILQEVKDGRKRVVELRLPAHKITELLPFGNEHISYAIRHGHYLYYVSGRTGIDNIYAKDLQTGSIYRVVSSRYGATNPVVSPDGKTMYYNELTVLGNDVARIALEPASWQPLEEIDEQPIAYYSDIVEQEGAPDILRQVPDKKYPLERYRKRPFNIHSWGPYLSDSPNEMEIGIYSTNVLSTFDAMAGFRIDGQGNTTWLTRASYQGLYPVIDLEASYANRQAAVDYTDTTGVKQTDLQIWKETAVKTGLRIPWVFTRNRFFSGMTVRNYLGYTQVRDYKSSNFGDNRILFTQLNNGTLLSNELRITFYSLHKRSKRDIRSKFGTVITFENYGTPYGGDFIGGLTALKTQIYFPGLFRHHSLNFFLGYQHNNITLDRNNYWFANRMPYPRGVSGSIFEDFYTARTNYELPLLYPDLSIGPWLYIQRIKTNLFFDYGYGNTNVINYDRNLQYTASDTYYSLGAELTFDFNFMRALPLAEMGVRFAYLPDQGQTSFEFVVGSFGF